MLATIQKIYNSCLFYGGVLLLPYSPGILAWKLFKNKKGKVPLLHRDLICDTETLMSLPKSETSLDECTTAFTPFIPLLTLNDTPWKTRRKILADGLRKIKLPDSISWTLASKQGDVYWDIFEQLFLIGFRFIFGRPPTEQEFSDTYPGIHDINSLIKRHTGLPNMAARWKLYNCIKALIGEKNEKFLFYDSEEFAKLEEVDQVSIVVEDILTSTCIQCTDLICHLLLLYSEHESAFKTHLPECIDETLRLYPLTDIWTRKPENGNRAWIASLVQLNRSGWEKPNSFLPERWNKNGHPPLISWGFDARSCPATKVAYNLSKSIFEHIISEKNLWIIPAANFTHERTFMHGCQLWVSREAKPVDTTWKFPGKFNSSLKQWFNTRLRVLDQFELW